MLAFLLRLRPTSPRCGRAKRAASPVAWSWQVLKEVTESQLPWQFLDGSQGQHGWRPAVLCEGHACPCASPPSTPQMRGGVEHSKGRPCVDEGAGGMLISDGDYCGGMGGTLAILPQAAILPAVTQQWGSTGPSVSGFADRAYGPTGGVHGQIAQDLAMPL